MNGVFTGLLDVYYAKMLTEDTVSSAPTYGVPAVLGLGIKVTITPKYVEGSLAASNKIIKSAKHIVGYDVSIGTDNLSPAVLKDVLGRSENTQHLQGVFANGTNSPNVAIGLAATYDDGTKEYWWLYKGQFAEITREAETEGDSLNYQTPTLEAGFVALKNNNALALIGDSNNSSISATVLSNWFNQVVAYGSTAALDVDELPVATVYAVATLPTSGNLHDIYVLTATDGTKAAGTMWRYMNATWTQYGATT